LNEKKGEFGMERIFERRKGVLSVLQRIFQSKILARQRIETMPASIS